MSAVAIVRWGRGRWALAFACLTAATLAVHGFHPLAEDGGLYVAGVKSLLHPWMFPRTLPFVHEHLRFSLFAPMLAAIVRAMHLSLAWVLLLVYLGSIGLTLFAIRELLRCMDFSEAASLVGTAMVAACWAMPVAATSLMLMDPYLTARSLTTPLTLLALVWSLLPGAKYGIGAAAALLIAAALHPLMALYGAAVVLAVWLTRSRRPLRNWLLATAITLVAAAAVQAMAPNESPAESLAAASRYYWFLSQWHWYEWMGLAGPATMFYLLARSCQSSLRKRILDACLILAAVSTLIALLFAQEHFRAHAIARLQPLRVFLELYAIMLAVLGATLAERCLRFRRILARVVPWAIVAAAAIGFVAVARSTYPDSPQVEWPWRANPNPWVEAFEWARTNTPRDALFALDARYVNRDGEDAQTFRATAERDAIPDYSKDGGEAAIAPTLAPAWLAGATAQHNLDAVGDAVRDRRLAPFGTDFVVLNATTATAHPCPYRNAVVKVCRLR